jgi:hypothetical protein
MIPDIAFEPHLLLTIIWLKNVLITRKIHISKDVTLGRERGKGRGER